MVYWYRLKIPFADWVMSKMFLAHYDIEQYNADNPLMSPKGKAGWPDEQTEQFRQEGEWPGQEEWETQGLPGLIGPRFSEHPQRRFYAYWAELMDAQGNLQP